MTRTDNNDVWQFPCCMPIKVMGPDRETLRSLAVDIIVKHIPDFEAQEIMEVRSRTGKYLSLTLQVTFENKNQVEAVFAEFSYHQQNGDDISFVI